MMPAQATNYTAMPAQGTFHGMQYAAQPPVITQVPAPHSAGYTPQTAYQTAFSGLQPVQSMVATPEMMQGYSQQYVQYTQQPQYTQYAAQYGVQPLTQQEFKQADANKDGKVDAGEVQQAIKKNKLSKKKKKKGGCC